jgi:hypothetical protein
MKRTRFGLGALAALAAVALMAPSSAAMASSHTAIPAPHRYPVAAMPGKTPLQSVAEAQVCAQYAAKAGFSFNNYITTNNGGSYPNATGFGFLGISGRFPFGDAG